MTHIYRIVTVPNKVNLMSISIEVKKVEFVENKQGHAVWDIHTASSNVEDCLRSLSGVVSYQKIEAVL